MDEMGKVRCNVLMGGVYASKLYVSYILLKSFVYVDINCWIFYSRDMQRNMQTRVLLAEKTQ